MIVPIKIEINNFLSIESELYKFQNGVPILIRGENLTNDGQKSNGSGKSTFQAALDYCINGSVARKVRDNELVRRGTEEANLTLFLKQTNNGRIYVIERCIRIKGSSTIEIEYFEDDKCVPIEKSSVPEYNKYIYEEIFKGVLKQDINDYYLLNEINYKPFFMKSDTDKKLVMSRFSNADLVDPVFQEVDSKRNEVTAILDNLDVKISNIDAVIASKKVDLEKEKSRDLKEEKREIESNIQEEIERKEKEIESLKDTRSEYSKEISKLNKEKIKTDDLIDDLNEKLDDVTDLFETSKNSLNKEELSLEEIKKSLSKEKQKKLDKISERQKLESQTSVFKSMIGDAIECPKCHHKFIIDSDMSIEEINKKIEENKKLCESFKKVETELEVSLSKVNESIQNVESSIHLKTENKFKFKKELEEVERGLTEAKAKLADLEISVNKYSRLVDESTHDIAAKITQIETLKKELETVSVPSNSKAIKDIENELKGFEVARSKVDHDMDIEVDKLETFDRWEVNFTLFKNFLINRKLKVIQSMINGHLKAMKSDISIMIEGFKVLSNGKIREKITPSIVIDTEVVSYGSLSKGEKTRVDVATLLAKQDLINQTVECGGFDLLFMDEVLEGLDSEGLSLLMKSLYNVKRTTLITTHNNEEGIHDKIVKFIKTMGVTKMELQYD